MDAARHILVVGAEAPQREIFVAELRGAGYRVDAVETLGEHEPADLVLVAGGTTGSRRDGFGAVVDVVIAARRATHAGAVLACIPRAFGADAVEASIESGADDVLILPPVAGELLARVSAALGASAARSTMQRYEHYADALSLMAASLGLTLDSAEGLHDILSRLCEAVGWSRAALLLCAEDPGGMMLVSASDDPSPLKIPVLLARYPEVKACLESKKPVLIEETRASALLGEWAELAAQRGGSAILAVPVVIGTEAVGAMLFRSERAHPSMMARPLDFLRLAALMMGLILKNGRVLEALREQTRRLTIERYNEERRSRALDQYKDFFESATDGMMVLDGEGRVLYLNRAAQQMTGYARDGLSGRRIDEIVAEPQRQALLQVVKRVVEGANLEWFDLQLMTTSEETLTLSVSSSSVLSEHGAAILAFRDVTEARELEAELRQTKDFLERLIDSTVDGIIAADLRGNVIIFNQGAERLYGYTREEVIGRIPVWRLYPEGVARAIMSELRAAERGGVGRLEPTRREIVTKEGDLVPAALAASIVYEGGREVASVGIISDLRERIRIEQRLAQAQEKLLATEKQALIAELAGTTAHELNQPLTSVMGYSELLRKKMTPEDPHYRAVDIILREAERMAEIVRKIGRITRYETKTYIGSTQILDLDKSTTDG